MKEFRKKKDKQVLTDRDIECADNGELMAENAEQSNNVKR